MSQPDRETLIADIRRVFVADGRVRLALLFGSVAQSRALPGSDVDLAVDAPNADLMELAARVSEKIGKEVDVVSVRSATIPLLEQLIADGIVVHESERGRAATWRAHVLSELELDRPWYGRMRDAWLARVAREGLGRGQ